MSNKFNPTMILEFPKSYFTQDFLDIEVKKNLAIRGDDLYLRIKPEYQDDATERFISLFTGDKLFDIFFHNDNTVFMILT